MDVAAMVRMMAAMLLTLVVRLGTRKRDAPCQEGLLFTLPHGNQGWGSPEFCSWFPRIQALDHCIQRVFAPDKTEGTLVHH